jgi:hypothetical protein
MKKNSWPENIKFYSVISMLYVVLILTVGLILILHHRDTVNNAMDTGECLVNRDVRGFFEMLRHLLHQAYLWIFNACG